MRLLRTTLGAVILGSLLPGQHQPETHPSHEPSEVLTGWRLVRFAQSDPEAPRLPAVVCYPAKASADEEFRARDARIQTKAGGYPVLVLLHGLGGSGGQMRKMGDHFARHGYIAVLTDTTRINRDKQAKNAHAFFQALKLCNADESSFLRGQLDSSRVGIGDTRWAVATAFESSPTTRATRPGSVSPRGPPGSDPRAAHAPRRTT